MNDEQTKLIGTNIGKPVVEVCWKDLTRVGGSRYRSECPVCEFGTLLIKRDEDHEYRLCRDDNCVLCGQLIRYVGEMPTDPCGVEPDDSTNGSCSADSGD